METIKISPTTPIGTQVTNLLQELAKFGKGERASKEAKRIRRNLRKLGYFINTPNTHHTKESQELPTKE